MASSRSSRRAQNEALAQFRRSGDLTALGICALCLLFVLLGFHTHFRSNARDIRSDCELPFMRPTYQKVKTPADSTYSLYRYREYLHDALKQSAVSGIPAIFIPGNAGSYKQVRTFASISSFYYKDYLEAKGKVTKELRKYDWYSIDTRESLLAFDAQGIRDVAAFVEKAMDTIAKRHSKRAKTLGIKWDGKFLVVGHSMGGVIARMLKPHRISQVLTLATPHSPPSSIAPVKRDLIDLYTSIAATPKSSSGKQIAMPTMVSVSGGLRDSLVNSDLAKYGISAQSEGVPLTWTSADHQAISWCKQLIDQCVRYIYASQTILGAEAKKEIAKEYFWDQVTPGEEFSLPDKVDDFDGRLGLLPVKDGERVEIWTTLHTMGSGDTDMRPEIKVSECGFTRADGTASSTTQCRPIAPKLLPVLDPDKGLAPDVSAPTDEGRISGRSFANRPWRATKYWSFQNVSSVNIEQVSKRELPQDGVFEVHRSDGSTAERVIDDAFLSIMVGGGVKVPVKAEGIKTSFRISNWLYSHMALTAVIVSPENADRGKLRHDSSLPDHTHCST